MTVGATPAASTRAAAMPAVAAAELSPAERVFGTFKYDFYEVGAEGVEVTGPGEITMWLPTYERERAANAAALVRDEIDGVRIIKQLTDGSAVPTAKDFTMPRRSLAARGFGRLRHVADHRFSRPMLRSPMRSTEPFYIVRSATTDGVRRLDQFLSPNLHGMPIFVGPYPAPGKGAYGADVPGPSLAPLTTPADLMQRYSGVFDRLGAASAAITGANEVTLTYAANRQRIASLAAAGIRDAVEGIDVRVAVEGVGLIDTAPHPSVTAERVVKLLRRIDNVTATEWLHRSAPGDHAAGVMLTTVGGKGGFDLVERLVRHRIAGSPVMLRATAKRPAAPN